MTAIQQGLTAAFTALTVLAGVAVFASVCAMFEGHRHAVRYALISSVVCVLATGLAVGIGHA